MAQSSDKILVIDIEATCWRGSRPADQQQEIIEIGICNYDVVNDVVGDKRSMLVRPVASEISEFCTQLTSITAERVADEGLEFASACRLLLEDYQARDYLWASWGGFDRKLFRKQCRRLGLSYPFGKKHLNIMGAYKACHGGSSLRMRAALRVAGLEFIGRHHCGADDAWNTARLLQRMVQRQGPGLIKRNLR